MVNMKSFVALALAGMASAAPACKADYGANNRWEQWSASSSTPTTPHAVQSTTTPITTTTSSPVVATSTTFRGTTPAPTATPTAGCTLGPAPGTTYTVVSGDTLTTIGQQFNVGICDIQAANSAQITDVNLIFPGEVLNIPSGLCSLDNTSCIPKTTPQNCLANGPLSYTVVSGDTLSAIASRFDLTLQTLENANQQVTNPDLIQVGQILNLPQCYCPTS